MSQRRLRLTSVLPVWGLGLLGVVLVLLFAGARPFAWMLLVMVASVLFSFVLQLATQTKDGLVARISASAAGSFVIVLIGTAILLFRQ